jgi:hypothetical protein
LKYKVAGADRETGEDIELTLDAENAESAISKAGHRGILVSECELVTKRGADIPITVPKPMADGRGHNLQRAKVEAKAASILNRQYFVVSAIAISVAVVLVWASFSGENHTHDGAAHTGTRIDSVQNSGGTTAANAQANQESPRVAGQQAESARREAELLAARKRETDVQVTKDTKQWRPVQPQANDTIDVSYDQFKDQMIVSTKNTGESWKMLVSVGGRPYQQPFVENGYGVYSRMWAVFDGQTIMQRPPGVGLEFNNQPRDMRGMFTECSAGDAVFVLVDGKSIRLKIARADSHTALVILPIDSAIALANGSSVEAKVSEIQFKFTTWQLGEFKKFLASIGATE